MRVKQSSRNRGWELVKGTKAGEDNKGTKRVSWEPRAEPNGVERRRFALLLLILFWPADVECDASRLDGTGCGRNAQPRSAGGAGSAGQPRSLPAPVDEGALLVTPVFPRLQVIKKTFSF
jgi:hypothetical protein